MIVSKEELDELNGYICSISADMDENYKNTGKSRLTFLNGEKRTYSDDELIELVKNKILASRNKELIINDNRTRYLYGKYKSFKLFIDNNFGEIYKFNEIGDDEYEVGE